MQAVYAVSLSSLSEGPRYTFWNSKSQSTVDYIIASHDSSGFIQKCFTHKYSSLNSSDHLPTSTVICVPIVSTSFSDISVSQKVDWTKTMKSGNLIAYRHQVSGIISPLLGKSYSTPDELDAEIRSVSQSLLSISLETLPQCAAPKRKHKWYKD